MNVVSTAYNIDWYRAQLAARDTEVARLQRALEGANRGAEKQRQRDHHEIFRDVLKARMENPKVANGDYVPTTPQMLVDEARELADLAYPPPKAAQEEP